MALCTSLHPSPKGESTKTASESLTNKHTALCHHAEFKNRELTMLEARTLVTFRGAGQEG